MKIIRRATKFGMDLTWKIIMIIIKDNYHNILLLADVLERFIDTCLIFYKIEPCHYFSSPRLSWDTMLKMTGVESEKSSEIKICL